MTEKKKLSLDNYPVHPLITLLVIFGSLVVVVGICNLLMTL